MRSRSEEGGGTSVDVDVGVEERVFNACSNIVTNCSMCATRSLCGILALITTLLPPAPDVPLVPDDGGDDAVDEVEET
jgi:hypothetical protein